MDSVNSNRVSDSRARHAAGKPVVEQAPALQAWLSAEAFSLQPMIETDGRAMILDLSTGSRTLGEDLGSVDVERLSLLIDRAMSKHGTRFAFGRWGERRGLYNNEHFSAGGEQSRTVHMGIDLFCAAQTELRAPLDGVVEIVANNRQELDYGPLIILRHTSPDGFAFFTLYGHLDLDSTCRMRPGQAVPAGQPIAAIGSPPQNGNWPPHLHFQIILDLLDLGADFPGVAFETQQAFWLALSPSPARFFPEINAQALDGRDRPST